MSFYLPILLTGFFNPVMKTFDFSGLSLGKMTAASFLTATGLTFLRGSVSTVQTSASTIDANPGVDDACIGALGTGPQGLVIQPNTLQQLGAGAGDDSPRDLTVAWSAGTATSTHSGSEPSPASPAGIGASRVVASSGQFWNYALSGAVDNQTWTAWERSVVADPEQLVWNTGLNNSGAVALGAGSTTWRRLEINGPYAYYGACDCRDYSGVGGTTAQARSIMTDYMQLERSEYSTEAIAKGLTQRMNDRIAYGTPADLFDSVVPRFRVRFSFYPKMASGTPILWNAGSATQGTLVYLLSWANGGNHNYIAIDNSGTTPSRKVKISIDGTTTTSTNAMTWSKYDLVEVYVECGGGLPAVVKYRVNPANEGAAWTDLVLTTSFATIAVSGTVKLFYNEATGSPDSGDSGQIPCWVKKVSFYNRYFPGV